MVFNVHYLFYPLMLLLHIDIECQQPLLQTATTATTSVAITTPSPSSELTVHPSNSNANARAAMTKYKISTWNESRACPRQIQATGRNQYLKGFNAPAKNHGLFGELSHEFHVLSIANLAQPVVVVLVLCAALRLLSLLGAGRAHAGTTMVRRRRWVGTYQ